jgi:hypothetical protein
MNRLITSNLLIFIGKVDRVGPTCIVYSFEEYSSVNAEGLR